MQRQRSYRNPTKHATDSDCARIHYIQTISVFKRPRELSRKAGRVLAFFRALFFTDKTGYLGTRIDFPILAVLVTQATGEACGRSTCFSAVSELVSKGYLLRTVTRSGRVRQYGPDSWARDKRTQLTVTEKARAVFLGPAVPVALAATGTDSAPREDIPLPVQDSHCDDCMSLSPSGKKPPAPGPGPVVSSSSVLFVEGNAESPSGLTVESGHSAACRVPPSGHLETRQEGGEGHFPCQSFKLVDNRRKRIDSILSVLAKLVMDRGGPGRRAIARAALEIADRKAQPRTPIAWEYWLERWPGFTPAERFAFARAEMVPFLLDLENVFRLRDRDGCGTVFKQHNNPEPPPALAPEPPPEDETQEKISFEKALHDAALQGNAFARSFLLNKGLDPGV